MTPQNQIIAIAELDGLLNRPKDQKVEYRRWDEQSKGVYELVNFPDGSKRPCYITDLPLYLTSRDAIVLVIEKQTMTIKDIISGILYNIQTRAEHQFIATPSQLCEALLRATGKWKD